MRFTFSTAAIAASMLLFIFVTTPADARIYKWVDENGKTHFGDKVPGKYKGQSKGVNVKPNTTSYGSSSIKKQPSSNSLDGWTAGNNSHVMSSEELKALQKNRYGSNSDYNKDMKRRNAAWKKKNEKNKSYDQLMNEYKSNQKCFGAARNENGTTNMAVAKRLGCKDVSRPTR